MPASYVIFTESTGDLTPALIEAADLRVLPMAFTLDGKEYRNYPDGREMSSHDYYEKLRAGSLCTTSQVTMLEFQQAFTPVLEAGQDILYLAFSSGLSGTYQSGCIAAEELKEKFPARRIVCVDSLQASMGEGLFCYLVGKKRCQGADLDTAADYARQIAPQVCAWFTVDDLMFLKRGGRVSGAAAVAGTLLGIKPVLHVDEEGHLIPKEKVRGRRASLDALVKHFEATALDKTGGTVFISHGDCADDARYVIDKLRALGVKEIEMGDIGPVIGAHSGPGTVALFWLGSAR
ncbi:MAG TPA: DegV family protein [Candidatus Gemmiger stercoravium]|nr:DegV family protein [Candidatus Gemmiger stercoravium]